MAIPSHPGVQKNMFMQGKIVCLIQQTIISVYHIFGGCFLRSAV